MRVVRRILLVAGLALLFYPLISGIIQKDTQESTIATYETQIEDVTEDNKEEALKSAESYNSLLYQTQCAGIAGDSQSLLRDESYEELLNVTGTGMMGSISIPKIQAELPIYHGTGDDVLAKAIGHVKNSSLPVGGENTHCVLSGHRGLPTAKLFTRLDELETGDLFVLQVCEEKLVYQVKEIQVILPEETDCLEIAEGKDLVSLVTCTPYGINSHRLVVTGERIPYEEAKEQLKPEFSTSWREVLFTILPFVAIFIVIVQAVHGVYKRKKQE